MFKGSGLNLGNLSRLSSHVTRSISPEHFTGEKGKGGMYTEGTGAKYAVDLGVGWKISPSVDIQPGELFTLADIKEQGMIQSMWMTGKELGRDSILRIYWDDQEIPSVECPAAYFHAQWRRTNPVPYKDVHVVLDGVRGRGHYVGMALFAGINSANGWWGEGEVKFYMDGDKEYPTICGTGLEDYFLGSWDWLVNNMSKYQPYSGPFAGMYQVLEPAGALNSQQRFGMYRFHVMDPVRFEKDLRITVQDLGWRNNHEKYLSRRDDFASVAYWYQTLPTAPFPPLPCNDDREII